MNNGLHARSSGEGGHVVLLHGLFGQGGNLRSVARALEGHYRVHCLDLPDHGRSRWLDVATLETYAGAVDEWMTDSGIDRAHVIGHSLGGKVAMQLALNAPARVNKLAIVDIAPVSYQGQHEQVLAAMRRVEAQGCDTRGAAQTLLTEAIEDPGVVSYLLMSLAQEGQVLRWRLNLAGLEAGYEQLRLAPTGLQAHRGETLFIRGALSSYIQPEHAPEMMRWFPHHRLVTIQEAGHWVHVDQSEAFCQQLRDYLMG